MRRWIAELNWPVMPRADDLPIGNRDRTDRNLALRLAATGFDNSIGHKLQVFSGRHVSPGTAPAAFR